MGNLNVKIDLIFKKVFGIVENMDLTKSLINSVLPGSQKIGSLSVLNPYDKIDYKGDGLATINTKAFDVHHLQYNIQIQLREQGFDGRWGMDNQARLYGKLLCKSENFDKLTKSIMINLLDFEYFPDNRYVRRCSFKDFDTNQLYPQLDYADIYYVELKKFDNDLKHIKNTLERWITFLNKASEYEKETMPKELAEPEIVKAMETLDRMSLNKKEREYYEGRKKKLRDDEAVIITAQMKGREEGREEGREKVAKQMKLDNEPIEKIMRFTGLTKEQIDRL